MPGNYEIVLKEAKATNANGEVSGEITKKDDSNSSNYLKLDLFSKNNQYLGSEYADISKLKVRRNFYFWNSV